MKRLFARFRKPPPVKIDALAAGSGRVRVRGRIGADSLVEAPSGTQCVLFRTKISRPVPQPGKEGAGPRWAQVAFDAKAAPFWIEDETGRIGINFSLDVDDVLFGLSTNVRQPSELGAGERALLSTERAPADGEIALARIAQDDSLRLQERLVMPGQIVEVTGVVQRVDDGTLELTAQATRPLAIAAPENDD